MPLIHGASAAPSRAKGSSASAASEGLHRGVGEAPSNFWRIQGSGGPTDSDAQARPIRGAYDGEKRPAPVQPGK